MYLLVLLASLHAMPGSAGTSAEDPAESSFLPQVQRSAPQSTRSTATADLSKPVDVTLTIRGGISLGAYEAGVNWVFLRFLSANRHDAAAYEPSPLAPRRFRLAALSGASAGNINAFLTAIEWCQDERRAHELSAIDSNLFWLAWSEVGLHNLFPSKDRDSFQPGDGLFSRNAFEQIKDEVRQRLADLSYRPQGCDLPVGVSLTRLEPTTVDLETLPIPTQRAFVPLRAYSQPQSGTLAFEQPRQLADFPVSLGQLVRLARPRSGSLNGAIFPIIEASSAFPVAFGARTIPVCEPRVQPEQCVDTQFLDGGVFDNSPIRLALHLASSSAPELVYIDPNVPQKATGRSADLVGRGLSGLFSFANGAVSTTRQAEMLLLAEELAPDAEEPDEAKPRLFLAQRQLRVFADQLGAFGAFFARAFRRYDYYVGVYDGARILARDRCYGQQRFWQPLALDTPARRDTCYFTTMRRFFEELDVERSPDAAYVFKVTMREEIEHAPVSADLKSFARDIALPGPAIKAVTAAIRGSSKPSDRRSNMVSAFMESDGMLVLLDRLAHDVELLVARDLPGADRDPEVVELDRIIDAPHEWAQRTVEDLIDRLRDIEEDGTAVSQSDLGEIAAETAQMLVRQSTARWATGVGFQDTLLDRRGPGWMLRLVPTMVVQDFKDAGGFFRYQLRAGLTEAFALTLPITPWWWQRNFDGRVDWRHFGGVGLGAQWRTQNFLVSALELDGHWFSDFEDDLNGGFAGEIAGYFLAGKLRLGFMLGRGPAFATKGMLPDGVIWTAGIADLPGLLYWFGRLGM